MKRPYTDKRVDEMTNKCRVGGRCASKIYLIASIAHDDNDAFDVFRNNSIKKYVPVHV